MCLRGCCSDAQEKIAELDYFLHFAVEWVVNLNLKIVQNLGGSGFELILIADQIGFEWIWG
jgi:hypothetical protein